MLKNTALILLGAFSLLSLVLAQDMSIQTLSYKNADLELKGFLYRPKGVGPFPAIVYNHGSEKNLAYIDKLAVPFVQQGYVFFAPNRRGQGRSAGVYILDALAAAPKLEQGKLLVKLHEEQLGDQLAGLAVLKTLEFVDSKRIGVYGWSFGGIQTMLAAERSDTAYKAAVNCAGAAQSWDGIPELQTRLLTAARAATVPIFFMQAQNDYSLTALKALSEEMQKLEKPYQTKIFPAFGSSHQDGHEFCVFGSSVWGEDVFEFFARTLK